MKITTSTKSNVTFKDIKVGELFYQYNRYLYFKISSSEAGRVADVESEPVDNSRYEFKDFESVARIREMHLVLEE